MTKGALGLLSAYWPEHIARHVHVPLERVTQACVHRQADAGGDRPAFVTADRRLTYAELSHTARAVAASLRVRLAAGARVAIAVADPAELLSCLLGCLEADLLAWVAGQPAAGAALRAFSPDLVIAGDSAKGYPTIRPEELFLGAPEPAAGRPNLNAPILALARPGRGEALHNHKTLVATAIAFGSFFLLEPGAEVVLFEPPVDWLGLAALLGTWRFGGTVYAAWAPDGAPLRNRVDYVVMSWDTAVARYLGGAAVPREVHAAAGALVGVSGPVSITRRRRLARRLGTPVLTVAGRNDLGPILASHPMWFLDSAVGIPLPNVDLRPLHPADGRPLAIGWDAVEEAEVGVKSSLAPAGGELVEGWLRTRLMGRVDPTGLYFLGRQVSGMETRSGAGGDR